MKIEQIEQIELLLEKYERESYSGLIKEKDKIAKEIDILLEDLIYELTVFEYIILLNYAEAKMSGANNRKLL